MSDRKLKTITALKRLGLLFMTALFLLGACNSQNIEMIGNIEGQSERTETAENPYAEQREKEQEAAPQADPTEQSAIEERFDEDEIWVAEKVELNLEEILENFGDPANYEVNIGEFKYLPGETFSPFVADQLAGGKHVIPYGIIASEPYVKTWTASNGESYNMWQVEMAFPNSEGEGWSSIPVTVWVDYSGKDIRMGNTAEYDVAESTSFGFSLSGRKSNSVDVGFLDEGYSEEAE